jgi:hypothetical protein
VEVYFHSTIHRYGVLLKYRESFVFTLTTVTGVWCGAGVVGESRDNLPELEAVVYFQFLSRLLWTDRGKPRNT